MRQFFPIQAPSRLTTNVCILLQMPGGKLTLKTEARTSSAYTQSNTFFISNELELVACHKYSASADRNSKQIPLQKEGSLLKANRKHHLPLSRHSKNLVHTRTKSWSQKTMKKAYPPYNRAHEKRMLKFSL